jgi:lipoate-protein ligase A
MDNIIVVRAAGARGPQGNTIGFNVNLVSYTYESQVPNNMWHIVHNLGFRPSVTVMDYGSNNVECDIEHINENEINLTFSQSASGYAYLS